MSYLPPPFGPSNALHANPAAAVGNAALELLRRSSIVRDQFTPLEATYKTWWTKAGQGSMFASPMGGSLELSPSMTLACFRAALGKPIVGTLPEAFRRGPTSNTESNDGMQFMNVEGRLPAAFHVEYYDVLPSQQGRSLGTMYPDVREQPSAYDIRDERLVFSVFGNGAVVLHSSPDHYQTFYTVAHV